MGLIIFAIVTWLLISIYTVMPRTIQIKESVFLFLLLLAISINATWFLVEEWHWITASDQIPEYLAFLLIRSVIIPYGMLLYLNLWLIYSSAWSKGLVVAGFVLTFLIIEITALMTHIMTYNKWSLLYSSIYTLAMLFIAMGTLRWYRNVF
ncbi:hypothetical protein ACFQZT_13650 [Paenibacillus sp. GCM10027628]|uniref:hypothetical protein n=1 Tax=Paenibacillus sp. GCM10027628 TaxID=3273413 RepID=UPI00362F449B